MSATENKAVVRRWFEEVMNQGNIDAVDLICEQCAPSFVVVKGLTDNAPGGLDGLKALVQGFHTAFPDLHFTIEDQIAEGNKVVTLVSIEGTNSGELMGMPATNNRISISGVSIWLVGEGKLVEEKTIWDKLAWTNQLGALPGSQPA